MIGWARFGWAEVLMDAEQVETGAGNATGDEAGAVRADRVTLRGLAIDPWTEAQTVSAIVARARDGSGGVVITANLDHLRRHGRDAAYTAIADGAEIVVADGMPLVWASRLAGTPLPERVAGSSMTWSLSRSAGEAGLTVALVGGDPGVAERAGEVLERECPGLRVVWTHCPPFGFENDPAEMAALVDGLRVCGADLVYVALGSPKQEKLAAGLRAEGVLPGAVWIGIGISLSFVTGDVSRAPGWVQKIGMEWAHRMLQEPRRLVKRYLIDGVPFAARLLIGALLSRGKNKKAPAGGGV